MLQSRKKLKRLVLSALAMLIVEKLVTTAYAFVSTRSSNNVNNNNARFSSTTGLTSLFEGRRSRLISLSSSKVEDVTYDDMTVSQLKDELRSRNLKVSGNKVNLIQRLSQYQNEDEENRQSDNIDNITHHGEIYIEEHHIDEENCNDQLNGIEETNNDGDDNDDDENAACNVLPPFVYETFSRRTNSTSLLPVQQRAYPIISTGNDAVLFAPTGSGKTLGYVLPLIDRHLNPPPSARGGRRRLSTKAGQPAGAKPLILVLSPSRELAKQVGKVWSSYCKRQGEIATVFGGAPIERHEALLRRKPSVVVGTPGRIRQLMREKHLSTHNVQTIVLDEADVLLDYADNPETKMLLEQGMDHDYQLVLASATINKHVRTFVNDVMEIEEQGNEGFILIPGVGVVDDDTIPIHNNKNEVSSTRETRSSMSSPSVLGQNQQPMVRHWHVATKSQARTSLTQDFIMTLSPRLTIIFVPSKAEAEAVSTEMASRLGGNAMVKVLHGDMVQAARTRTVAALCSSMAEEASIASPNVRVLVATDVASRGLDLPNVDLVIQYGLPRRNGKAGTWDVELYTHRSGRAGRVGGDVEKGADAILMYDPLEGESKTLVRLVADLQTVGIELNNRSLPSPSEVMTHCFDHVKERCNDFTHEYRGAKNENDSETGRLVDFFRGQIEAELQTYDGDKNGRDEYLLQQLAIAMAALSGLDSAVPDRSLLTADARDRTLRVTLENKDGDNIKLTPPQVISFSKSLGSGKLGRVSICEDGSAVFDLPYKRAVRLVEAANDAHAIAASTAVPEEEWFVEIITKALPPMANNR